MPQVRFGRSALGAVVLAGLLVATFVVPAVGGPSLRKLVKQEVTKQLAGKTGPQGTAGAPGAPGGPGAAGQFPAAEAPHVVGTGGEPPFANGVENDCVWSDGLGSVANTARASFHKEGRRVYLGGIIAAANGPGGDNTCNFSGAEGQEDGVMFTLPAAYRPDVVEALPVNQSNGVGNPGGTILIGADEATDLGGGNILQPGEVAIITGTPGFAGSGIVLGSLSFLAKN